MARKSKPKPIPAATAVPAMPLFERPAEGEIAIRVKVAGNNRLANFKDFFGEANGHYDKASSANGKAREVTKAFVKATGIHAKAISLARQLKRMDPKEAVAVINDTTLLCVDLGIFDDAEAATQAEEAEANQASVDAAERAKAAAPAPIARRTGEPPATGPLSACFWQGDEAFKSGAPIDDCPADYSEDKAGWWREGFLRAQEAERPVRATSAAGKISTGASAA